MDVLIQWVRTSWTTASRGAPGAFRRNAAPIGFRLPGPVPPLIHEIRMDEKDEFAPRSTAAEGEPAGVLLAEADDLLRVELVPDPLGRPRRWRRPPSVHLAPGEWLRWQINYRFSGAGDGGWHYRLDTLNLAYRSTDLDLFLGAPHRHIDERASLR